jgi:HSP20 family protein
MNLPEKRQGLWGNGWIPNCDFLVSKSGIRVLVEIAGLRSAEINIEVQMDCLQITGTRPRPPREDADEKIVGEINYGPFQAVLKFPAEYDLTQAKATYLNGFLRIDVPAKIPAVGPTRIVF